MGVPCPEIYRGRAERCDPHRSRPVRRVAETELPGAVVAPAVRRAILFPRARMIEARGDIFDVGRQYGDRRGGPSVRGGPISQLAVAVIAPTAQRAVATVGSAAGVIPQTRVNAVERLIGRNP